MTPHPTHSDGSADPPGPADPADPITQANELFAHGLLLVAAPGEAAARDARIRRVLDELKAARRWTIPFPRFRALAAAAVIGLAGLTVVILFSATEQRAQALLRESITALRAAAVRRYVALRQDAQTGRYVRSTSIDSAGDGRLLVRHRLPDADGELVMGRDEIGYWHLRRDRSVARGDQLPGMPLWATVGPVSFFTHPLDDVLEELARTYTLTRLEPAPLPGRTGPALIRVVAQRDKAGTEARRIEVWIDPETHIPERIELSDFPPPPGGVTRRGHPPPPASVVIERVSDEIEPDWFSPERWAR